MFMGSLLMLTSLTLRQNVSCVNIDFMTRDSTDRSSYHHGDLRAALISAAAAEIERGGYEKLSLRELAGALRVALPAPLPHFPPPPRPPPARPPHGRVQPPPDPPQA